MRGKDDQLHEGSKQFRITPAYAGKNCKFSTSLVNNWDHPRICGEKVWMLSAVARAQGSPPRMRGKDGLRDDAQRYRGITPAYAGKSL